MTKIRPRLINAHSINLFPRKCKLLKDENESNKGIVAQCTAQIKELNRATISIELLLIFIFFIPVKQSKLAKPSR